LSRKIGASTLLFAFAVAIVAAAGCGGGDNNNSSSATTSTTNTTSTTTTPAGGGAASNLKIAADPSGALKFDKDKLSAKAGAVKITMDNPSSVPHAVAVEGNGVDKSGETVNQGGVSTVTADLKPGTYEFYCPVDGHKQAGMKGTLTVK
jgi:plastocyanin